MPRPYQTLQSQNKLIRHILVLLWSETSRPKWDHKETSSGRWVPAGLFLVDFECDYNSKYLVIGAGSCLVIDVVTIWQA